MTVALTNASIVTFITTDPRSVGFSAIRTAHPGQDQPLVDAANNASGPGAGTVAGDPITAGDLLDMIDGDEYNTMTSAQLIQLQTIMTVQSIDVGSTPMQSKLNSLFATYATSLAAIRQTYTRAAGPWETYFGKGSLASTGLLDSARNSNGGNQF